MRTCVLIDERDAHEEATRAWFCHLWHLTPPEMAANETSLISLRL